MIDDPHGAQIPQVASMLPVCWAPNRVPKARGVHSLTAVVSCWQQILRPEEFFSRIVNQHRIVSYGAAIIIEVVRALAICVISATVDRQVTLMVDRDLVLIEVLVFGQIRTTIEFDPG